MTTCISKQLQIYASRRPHLDDKFLLSNNFKPKFTSIRMLNNNNNNNNNTCFRSCSVSSSSSSSNLVDHRSILVHSCNGLYPICNLFDDIRNNLSRTLASSVLLLPVMTLALLCIQVPASAASYGKMGASSSGGGSSDFSYLYDDDDDHNSSCNCKTPTTPRSSRSCTICDCYKEKGKSCADCSCADSVTSNCNCNCHIPCQCSCHIPNPVNRIAGPLFIIIFCIGAVLCAIIADDTIGNDWLLDDIALLDEFRWGSVIMIQVGILDKKRVLQRKLNRIGGTANIIFKSDLKRLLKEVVESLFEHLDHCHFAYLYAKYDNLEESSRPRFRGFLETEREKFDKNDETFVNVDGVKYRKESNGKVNRIDNEYSVVTLLVLVEDEYLIPSVKRNSKRVNKGEVKTALETILSIPRRNLEGVEVLWTPQMENDVVPKQDVLRDFGFRMRPVDLTK
ncbi:myelin-associated oligodendrocyte basic protein [Trifolium repens]|nr:myelin-associated oligodendrocyte basic protein [Trifolium repens]